MPRWNTPGFKEQAVQKALDRGNTHLKTIAQELNVGYSTLQKWISAYKSVNTNEKNQKPQNWSREQQFQALVDTAAMDDEHRNQYCREKGLFPHHLAAWRQHFLQIDKKSVPNTKAELKSLKDEISSLQKEIRRKDKALAETAALLVLQKKFQALLEEKD